MASGTVHPDVFRRLRLAATRELGSAVAGAIFADVNLTERLPIDVAMGVWGKLWDEDVDGDLGARLGKFLIEESSLGAAFIDACGAEATLARGLRVLARHYQAVSTSAEVEIELKDADKDPALWIRLLYGPGPRLPIVGQCTLQAIRTGVSTAMGRECPPRHVYVAAPVSEKLGAKLAMLFDAPVTGGVGYDALVFPGSLAQTPMGREPTSRESEWAKASLAALANVVTRTTLQEDVAKEIQAILPESPKIQRVASALDMGQRTFQKRLEAEGIRFRDICTETRMEIARGYLGIGTPVAQVAFLVGYTDPTTFARAFRKYAGHAPSKEATSEGRKEAPVKA